MKCSTLNLYHFEQRYFASEHTIAVALTKRNKKQLNGKQGRHTQKQIRFLQLQCFETFRNFSKKTFNQFHLLWLQLKTIWSKIYIVCVWKIRFWDQKFVLEVTCRLYSSVRLSENGELYRLLRLRNTCSSENGNVDG